MTHTPQSHWRTVAIERDRLKAINAQLLAALEKLLPLAETAPDYVDPGYHWAVEAILDARTAIAKAQEESAP